MNLLEHLLVNIISLLQSPCVLPAPQFEVICQFIFKLRCSPEFWSSDSNLLNNLKYL